MIQWKPIRTAPRNGKVILVDDTTSAAMPWAAARWVDCDEWQGFVYDDDVMSDTYPLGPEPWFWLPIPPLEEWQPIASAPKDGSIIVVNDTVTGDQCVTAYWLQDGGWSGWIYDDEAMRDHNPIGPEPTSWLPLPPVPPFREEDL